MVWLWLDGLKGLPKHKASVLLPLVRKGTGELLTGIGLAATNEQGEAVDPVLEYWLC
jgi:hypothetical protein